jgi:hypothetical protein
LSGSGLMFDPADRIHLEQVYRNYRRHVPARGIEPVTRERALGLVLEWTAVLSERLGPTTQ